MADINAFKSKMLKGGARSNQFTVAVTPPTGLAYLTLSDLPFFAKSATLPSSRISTVTAMYRGRAVHFAGEREFEPWTIEIYSDVGHGIRTMFETWVQIMQNADSTGGLMAPEDYQGAMNVWQLDRSGESTKGYLFNKAFPTEVSPIQLSWEDNNQIETFQVTFMYDYWTLTADTVTA